jgi:hypothetical protein
MQNKEKHLTPLERTMLAREPRSSKPFTEASQVPKRTNKVRSGEEVHKDLWETLITGNTLPTAQGKPLVGLMRLTARDPNVIYGDKRPDTNLPVEKKKQDGKTIKR